MRKLDLDVSENDSGKREHPVPRDIPNSLCVSSHLCCKTKVFSFTEARFPLILWSVRLMLWSHSVVAVIKHKIIGSLRPWRVSANAEGPVLCHWTLQPRNRTHGTNVQFLVFEQRKHTD